MVEELTDGPHGQGALSLARLFADPPLLGALPRALSVAPDGRHVGWLQPRNSDQLRHDLWVEHLASGRRWMAADSLALAGAGAAAVSEAELMRRERARLASLRGIFEYHWAPNGESLLVALDGGLWLVPLDAPPVQIVPAASDALDGRLSPDGRHASFVQQQNLWVARLDGSGARPLTTAGGGDLSFGVAEFVAQEEMHRTSGQWWAPDGQRLAVARVDESGVAVAERAAIGARQTAITRQRYPYAGTANAIVGLEICALDGGAPILADLGADPDYYLARVCWCNPHELLVARQSRDQTRLDVLLVDAASGRARLLVSEHSDSWINLHHSLWPLADGKRFLWASERSGFRHLYLWADGRLHQLTQGDWPVDELLGVDEESGRMVFTGWRETPLEKAVYEASLAGGDIRRLSAAGSWTEAVADRRGRTLLLTASTPQSPPAVSLWQRAASGPPQQRRIAPADYPYAALLPHHRPPQFGTLKSADGATDLHYALTLPDGTAPAPLFFEIYGGPGVQRVRHGFGSLLHQYLRQQGWAIFQLDGRGTPARGTQFEAVIHRRLGFPEVADQMAAMAWLQTHPRIDSARVAIYGWSYGGFMVQRLLTRHPGIFAAGVSGAPVTDWRLYDTHYTERYLGNPTVDAAPYAASDIVADAAALQDPLLIIHGLADDNVIFDHSARVIAAYQQAGCLFETMIYPGETHGIRTPALQTHLWRTILAFLQRNVLARRAPLRG